MWQNSLHIKFQNGDNKSEFRAEHLKWAAEEAGKVSDEQRKKIGALDFDGLRGDAFFNYIFHQ